MPPSDSSDLSSPPISDSEAAPPPPQKKTLKLKYGKLSFSTKRKAAPVRDRESSPDEPEREPSPPHDYALADNPDIAVSSLSTVLPPPPKANTQQFIVMFRARFAETFPKNVPNLGPQDVERGVGEPEAGEHVENLLCALIGLVLNRKKYVEYGRLYSLDPRPTGLIVSVIDVGTMDVRWRRPSLHKRASGPKSGRGSTLCMATTLSRQCRRLNELVLRNVGVSTRLTAPSLLSSKHSSCGL